MNDVDLSCTSGYAMVVHGRPKTPKNSSFLGSHSPYIPGDTTRPGHLTCGHSLSKSDRRRLRKTLHKQTDTTKIMVTWPWTKNDRLLVGSGWWCSDVFQEWIFSLVRRMDLSCWTAVDRAKVSFSLLYYHIVSRVMLAILLLFLCKLKPWFCLFLWDVGSVEVSSC